DKSSYRGKLRRGPFHDFVREGREHQARAGGGGGTEPRLRIGGGVPPRPGYLLRRGCSGGARSRRRRDSSL
ncbi:hypothetical protein AVDCRST_MAG82-2394, partial [uncultured Rubrobacteraceae bacterium]